MAKLNGRKMVTGVFEDGELIGVSIWDSVVDDAVLVRKEHMLHVINELKREMEIAALEDAVRRGAARR